MDKYVCIDNFLLEDYITIGKYYKVYVFNYSGIDGLSHITIIDDNENLTTHHISRFREVKLYPNTKLFRLMYPNNKVVNNMIVV